MTKIKNTKKGMAKKTLSMSLVVAMLATSNVPVWAAEFSDGTDATVTSEAEAPAVDTAEEFSDDATEAPVIDSTEDVTAAQAEDSKYNVSFKDVPEKAEWAQSAATDNVKIKVKVTNPAASNNNINTTLNWVAYVTDNGVEYPTTPNALTEGTNGYAELAIGDLFSAANVGKKVRVRVYELDANNNITWYEDSADITVAKQTLTGSLDLTGLKVDETTAVHYTGKTITSVPTTATANNTDAKYTYKGQDYGYSALTPSSQQDPDVKLSTFTITGEDLVNAVEVSNKKVTATADIESKYYDGKFTVTYEIWRKTLSSNEEDKNYIGNNIKVELPKYAYQYTGNPIQVKAKDITVTDLNTGKTVENAVSDTDGYVTISNGGVTTSTTETPASINLKAEGSLANYTTSTYGTIQAKTAEKVSVAKRDLADTTNTVIEISTVTTDVLGANKVISADGLKNNLTIKDADGSSINKSCVKIDMGELENQPVVIGNTYTVTVKPATGNTNVTGSRQVTFKVLARTISDATFTAVNGVNLTEAEDYTGEQITKGLTNITTDNFESKVGTLTKGGTKLIPGVDYSATLEFGENKNKGVAAQHTGGKIVIKGLGAYEGSEKTFEFDINAVDANVVEIPEKVLLNTVNQDGKDYSIVPTVFAKYTNTKTNKKYKLTVPTDDYEITSELVSKKSGATGTNYDDYEVTTENKAGNYIRTTITKKANTTSNFNIPEKTSATKLFAVTAIVNKAITDSDIQMNKTTYTYTGKEVVLDYKVVVDGVELEKGVDYEETITNGKNVGEGLLTIKGKGDYDNTTASAKFTIEAAKTSDLKVAVVKGQENAFVYDGNKKKPTIGTQLSVTLNGEDVSSEFVVSYPTSKTANVNVGKGQVTLTPKKDNKNFQGVADFTFDITAAQLSGGEFKVFNERNDLLNDDSIVSNPLFKYDGTAHTFAKATYTKTVDSPMKLTADDYEIKYAENISGVSDDANSTTSTGYIFVVAKGNYKNTIYGSSDIPVVNGVYTFADGSKIENIVAAKKFSITKLAFDKDDITVSNGSYKGGNNVEPDVTVSYKGKKLIKDVDYTLSYTNGQDRTKVTNGKTLDVTINGKGGYCAGGTYSFKWGIDKFDFANATILVSGTDADPVIKVMNGSLLVDEKEYDLTVADGKATIIATKDNKNYTGTQTVDIKHELEKPTAPMISSVKVVGNKATVILSGDAEGAAGYDYVISKDRDCITNKDYDSVNKNQVQTSTTFKYVQQGTYYAYCHAWKRDENGKKVFGEWSNAYPFSVTAITPDAPVITNVKVSGSTIKVTYKAAANATGYDVVLGTSSKKENGETRPYNYGAHKVLNLKEGTVTATFKNVPAGKWTVGMHAFNRTSEDGKKVFSPWSNLKTATVK